MGYLPSDDLFNVSMTKAEQSAADQVWQYLQKNSFALNVLEVPQNTKTNLTYKEALVSRREQSENPRKTKKAHVVPYRGAVSMTDLDANDDYLKGRRVHRLYGPDGNEVWIPTFEIACSPTVRFIEAIGSEAFVSRKAIQESSESLCMSLDQESYNCVLCGLNENKKSVVNIDKFFASLGSEEYSSIVISHSLAKNNFDIINRFQIKWHKDLGQEDSFVVDAGTAISANGIIFPVHISCDPSNGNDKTQGTLIALPVKYPGSVIIDQKPYVIKNRNAIQLRINLVVFMSIGICSFGCGMICDIGKKR